MKESIETSLQAVEKYREERVKHWDGVATRKRPGWSNYYHQRIAARYQTFITPGLRILELGSGEGNLLAALKPSQGVGVDFSPEMNALARERHPEIQFFQADAHDFVLSDQTFDCIVLSEVINDLWDVQQVLEHLADYCSPSTRILFNFYNHLWGPLLGLLRAMGLARPLREQNWLTVEDLTEMLEMAGYEVVRRTAEVLLPLNIPLLSPFLNKFLVRIWPFRHLAMSNFLVARRKAADSIPQPEPVVSVIVAARNEAGNIEQIFSRIPRMGGGTELIFVEGHSSDDTYGQIEKLMPKFPHIRSRLFRQTGEGKGDAVRLGFTEATGEVLMILDADLTVLPEALPKFYRALISGHGEFINGVRLVYPMADQAMRFFNLLGNKFFSLAFSWLLDQRIKDTLCGTKVMWKKDYERIAANRQYFGEFDPFGDFDLLFGAARLNLRIVDLPVRYQARTYGETNIQRWRHGLLLLRMVVFAARKIKFI